MRTKCKILGLTAAAGMILFLSACTKNPDAPGGPPVIQDEESEIYSLIYSECDFSAVLTENEISGLLHMREEEKLARDIYLRFSEIFNIPIFRNIAASEQRHMDAVLFLINGYGLTDPVKDLEIGSFTDAFQELYDKLYAQGSQNLEQAYEAGVFIEEQDIEDLKEYISETEVTNIINVYTNLLNASSNHLNAFKKRL